MSAVSYSELRVASRVMLKGRVQGIGLRPAIARFARQLDLRGFVCNSNVGVEVHVEGAAESVARFTSEICTQLPTAANVTSLKQAGAEVKHLDAFTIAASSDQTEQTALSTRVPVDLAVCDRCCDEIRDATNRRKDYPFTSCTDCGPRYSIIQRMPYERRQTSMAKFSLCEECQREYDSPSDRRFHAQTNACSQCGPQLWACDANDRVIAHGHDAIDLATETIYDGGIVALRGLGGYQLLADATLQKTVERLRRRKRRTGKPLAVMVSCLSNAEQFANLNNVERELLTSPAGPIVVVEAIDKSSVAASVTHDAGTIGLLLPTTPLHQLLLDRVGRPLVCTSGNVDGEPLAYERKDAIENLHSIADVWLQHNRPIARPIDDSVVRVIAGRAVTLRLARGFAPLDLDFVTDRPMIAVGGQQKMSIAISNGSQTILGPHIGDMNTIAGRQRFVTQVNDLTHLYGMRQFDIVCDMHPDYFTTEWCQNQPNVCVQVQHHHAHIAAGMLQHGWLEQQVLGVAFDGTGYGADGTTWGGEFLLCTASEFQRVGHLRPFALLGGDRAMREPWRVATALVRDALGDSQAAELRFDSGDVTPLMQVLSRPGLSPMTTSAGRLFDGIAALVLGIERCDYEGQAAMALEAACDESASGQYGFSFSEGRPKIVDWRPMVRQLMQDRDSGVAPAVMAMRFHRGLAMVIMRFCSEYSFLPVVLGGGVFHNRVLVELLTDQMSGRVVGFPGMIPVGDGGLAAGQLVIADALARERRSQSCV